MSNDRPRIEELAAELLQERKQSFTGHPSLEELLSVRRGKLASEEAAEILRHLGACTVCADQLLFYLDDPSATEILRGRIAAGLRNGFAVVSRWLWPSDRRLVWNLARAAGGFAAAWMLVVPSLRLDRAQQVIAEMSQPQTSVEIFHVKSPVRGREASSSEETVFDIASEDRFFAVSLSVESGFEARQLRILDQDQKEIWKSRDLRLDPLGVHLRLGLSRRFVGPGKYFIEISGLEDGFAVPPRLYPVRFNFL